MSMPVHTANTSYDPAATLDRMTVPVLLLALNAPPPPPWPMGALSRLTMRLDQALSGDTEAEGAQPTTQTALAPTTSHAINV
jgi:hypothetical protein